MVIAVEAAQLAHAQPYRPGAVPGVAAVGRVVAVGEQTMSLLELQVLVGSIDPCGQCEVCRRGGGTVCPHAHHRGGDARGTLAERITVAGKWVVPLGGELRLDRNGYASDSPGHRPVDPATLAALAGDAALAYTAYARSDLAPRDPVVLLGCAPVTRFLVEILLAKGLAPVVLLERAMDEHGYERSDGGWRHWLEDRGVATVVLEAGAELAETREEIEAAMGRRERAKAAAAAAAAAAKTAAAAGAAVQGSAAADATKAPASQSAASKSAASKSPAASGSYAAPASGPSPASASASAEQRGRPWKLIASEPRCLHLATRLAGPRAQVTAIVPPWATASEPAPYPGAASSQGLGEGSFGGSAAGGSADSLLSSLVAGAEAKSDRAAPLQGLVVDPTAWIREVTILSVTEASPELLLETAALVVRGELDLDAGVAVVDLGDLDPASVAALGPTRSLVVRVPQARS